MNKAGSLQFEQLPDFTLVIASAGSGKTTALTQRYLSLIMTEGLPHNNLRHILAITFTRNAAREMKERILDTLKHAALGHRKALDELRSILPLDDEILQAYAAGKIDEILDNYSDFQIQTIDSFITRVLRASAIDLGLPPEFEVEFGMSTILDEALDLFAREIATDRMKQQLLDQLIDLIQEQQSGKATFLWNPFEKIRKEVGDLSIRLAGQIGEPVVVNVDELKQIERAILERVLQVAALAERSGLDLTARYAKIVELAQEGDIRSVVSRELQQSAVKKSRDGASAKTIEEIRNIQVELAELVSRYLLLKASRYYLPYLEAYRMVQRHVERVKRQRGRVVLAEASRALAMMLNAEVVPEIFFSLGEQVHHFLIDEFQDTSPIQWAILRPLVENALGGTGSLFLVGDTKQSIYTFRGADWRIMRRMVEREEFPSVQSRKLSLGTNYRSAEAVVEFSKQVFHRCVPELISRDVCDLSGLASYQQEVQEEKRGTGYVEVRSVPPATDDEEDERRENPPEREHLLRILAECRSRGYGYGDIAILTPRNKHVVEVSRWLNAAGIRFISHSSLDIRTRKLTGELLALLQFLDSPVNDLAFATFLLGNIFATSTPELKGQQIQAFILRARKAESPRAPLYRQFRTAFGGIWNRLFEHLFNVIGYLPVYDLVAEVYKTFDLFNAHPDEEATLVKFLEVIKNFEESGSNSLKDFLAYAERDEREESDEWNIPTGESEDAVRIMTVHKAKGLGFPILVTLFYDHRVKPDNRFLVGEGEGVKLIHVTSAESKNSVELAAYYKEARAFAEVDELNKLYVSLTRAREELYIISVQNTWGKYPSQFFPQDGFKLGQPSRKQRAEAVIGLTAERLHQPTRGFAQATTVDAVKLRETRRGELIHNVLSEIEYLDAAIERSIEQALVPWLRTMREPLDRAETKKLLLDFLQQPEVCQYFSAVSGRRVLNEQELVDNAGRLHRVDRLVIDEDVVTVLDYKTGEEHESHHAQVREYMQIVRELYPKKRVRGVLLYIDRTRVREVQ